MTHPTHRTRYSDASTFDEICTLCGATDSPGSDALNRPCYVAPSKEPVMIDEVGFKAALEGEGWHDRLNHYAYADWLQEQGRDDEAAVHRKWTPARQAAAERFMDEYAEMISGDDDPGPDDSYREYTRDQVIEAARESLSDRRGHGTICLGFDTPDGVYAKRKEFWEHFSVLTGVPVAEGYDSTFVRCAC